MLSAAPGRLEGLRIIVANLDVHDLARDVLAKVLSALGAEVVLLPGDSQPAAVIVAAVQEAADLAVVSSYNGAALRQASEMSQTARRLEFGGAIIMGGVLNEDLGGPVPVDVADRIRAQGIHCLDDLRGLPDLIGKLTVPG